MCGSAPCCRRSRTISYSSERPLGSLPRWGMLFLRCSLLKLGSESARRIFSARGVPEILEKFLFAVEAAPRRRVHIPISQAPATHWRRASSHSVRPWPGYPPTWNSNMKDDFSAFLRTGSPGADAKSTRERIWLCAGLRTPCRENRATADHGFGSGNPIGGPSNVRATPDACPWTAHDSCARFVPLPSVYPSAQSSSNIAILAFHISFDGRARRRPRAALA